MTNSGTGSRLSAAVAVALTVMPVFGPTAWAQQAQEALPRWVGQLEFSTDGVVKGVRTTIADRMDIVLESNWLGHLRGTLVATRNFKQLGRTDGCDWEITVPNKLRGELQGFYRQTPGAIGTMSIQLINAEVAPAPRKNCPGGGYIHSGDSIHDEPNFKAILQSQNVAVDGTIRSSMTWATGPMTNSLSLTLRRIECHKNMPDRGMVYIAGSGNGKLYSSPATSSPVVGMTIYSQRLLYTQTTRVNGQTWYFVLRPGGITGWVPESDISCTRLRRWDLPVQMKPMPPLPNDLPLSPAHYNSYGGGRG